MGIGKVLGHAAERFGNQKSRIHEGKRSEQLTDKEAAKLNKKEQKLEKWIVKHSKDGFTPAEENRLDKKQDKLSKQIYKQKHDGQNGVTPKIDKRADRLETRVTKGIESGQLNEKEAGRMNNRLAELDAAVDEAKSDGKVTKKERRELQAMERDLSFRVLVQKNDSQGS